MRRDVVKKLTAVLMGAALLLTGVLPALAEDGAPDLGFAVPVMPAIDLSETGNSPAIDAPAIATAAPAPSASAQVTNAILTEDGAVSVQLTSDKAYAVTVTLSKVEQNGARTPVASIKLNAGVMNARFENVAPGSYELTAAYTTATGAKSGNPFPVTVPQPAPVATAAPTPEATAIPVMEPVPMPTEVPMQDVLTPAMPAETAPQTQTLEMTFGQMMQVVLPEEWTLDSSFAVEDPSQDQPEASVPDVMLPVPGDSQGTAGWQITVDPEMFPDVAAGMEDNTATEPEAGSEEKPGTEPGTEPEADPEQSPDGEEDEDAIVKLSNPVVSGSTVSGTVSNVDESKTLVITLKSESGGATQSKETTGQTTVNYEFTDIAPGTYTLTIGYKEGGLTLSTTVTVTASALTIAATATGGTDSITVNVTTASAQAVDVKVMKDGAQKGETKTIGGGTGSVTIDGLEKGTYSVVVSYQDTAAGVGPTTIENVVVTGALDVLTITSVTPGENKITVKGKASANADIIVTIVPSSTSTSAYVHTDANGDFTAEIALPAGTYTTAFAQYVNDPSKNATATGTWTVTSPATPPELIIDAITDTSIVVYAKTNPGIKVTLTNNVESAFSQTVTADSDGILRFSLPHTYLQGTVFTFTAHYGEGDAQTLVKTVTVTASASYRLLKVGSYGEDVYALTTRLNQLGYPINPTYNYTESVAAAVRLFQSINGLAVDGMAGVLTQSQLFSIAAIAYHEGQHYPTLVRGDRGWALIYTLQQRLKDLGYYTIKVDGIFGSATERAVRDFQRVNGLAVTGRADNTTQQLLYSSAAKPAWSGGGWSYRTLSRSSRYQADVVPLQRRLKMLGYYSGNIDGYFGSQTQRAVRNFQSRNGITVTGVADGYTQMVLYSADARAASGSSSSTGYRLLYWGCKGEDVRRLQQALLNAGYTQVRTVDGIYGQWTYDAVKAFQRNHGLAVDGIAGRNTQNALYGTHY